MQLFFSYIWKDGSIKTQSLLGAELEDQVEVLNTLVSYGYTILWAYIIDQDGFRTDLPVEAFDGSPMGESLQKLQVQYQQLVSP